MGCYGWGGPLCLCGEIPFCASWLWLEKLDVAQRGEIIYLFQVYEVLRLFKMGRRAGAVRFFAPRLCAGLFRRFPHCSVVGNHLHGDCILGQRLLEY